MIIGVSGHINSGKDTVGNIIRELDDIVYPAISTITKRNWQIVKYADALKDIVCILTGCTREQLEDNDFKNSKLPKEWESEIPNGGCNSTIHNYTYRKLLQILGTDLLRNQLHENVWVNALMSKYKVIPNTFYYKQTEDSNLAIDSLLEGDLNKTFELLEKHAEDCKVYPNWIITDVRFPNEVKAIKDRDGIIIRVNREDNTGQGKLNPHTSETALDDYEFDYIIDNFGTIEQLKEKVKTILIEEQLL